MGQILLVYGICNTNIFQKKKFPDAAEKGLGDVEKIETVSTDLLQPEDQTAKNSKTDCTGMQ